MSLKINTIQYDQNGRILTQKSVKTKKVDISDKDSTQLFTLKTDIKDTPAKSIYHNDVFTSMAFLTLAVMLMRMLPMDKSRQYMRKNLYLVLASRNFKNISNIFLYVFGIFAILSIAFFLAPLREEDKKEFTPYIFLGLIGFSVIFSLIAFFGFFIPYLFKKGGQIHDEDDDLTIAKKDFKKHRNLLLLWILSSIILSAIAYMFLLK
jgi:hypothetical protein